MSSVGGASRGGYEGGGEVANIEPDGKGEATVGLGGEAASARCGASCRDDMEEVEGAGNSGDIGLPEECWDGGGWGGCGER